LSDWRADVGGVQNRHALRCGEREALLRVLECITQKDAQKQREADESEWEQQELVDQEPLARARRVDVRRDTVADRKAGANSDWPMCASLGYPSNLLSGDGVRITSFGGSAPEPPVWEISGPRTAVVRRQRRHQGCGTARLPDNGSTAYLRSVQADLRIAEASEIE
jgi:hypothetical protein